MRVIVEQTTEVNVVTSSEGPQGPVGPPGSGTGFVHEQTIPAAVWDITHDLNKFPSVVLTDELYVAIDGLVEYLSLDVLQVTFNTATAGKAVLN